MIGTRLHRAASPILIKLPGLGYLLLCLILFAACVRTSDQEAELYDASGVVRNGDSLLLVDDEIPSAYFRFPLRSFRFPGLVRRGSLEKVTWPQEDLAIDLESIELLADGRVVVLSERLRALIDQDGLVAQYEAPFGEMGKRGLEGLAVMPLDLGASRLALLWEGGYPEDQELSPEARPLVSGRAFRPMIVVHTVARGARGLKVRATHLEPVISLNVPLPQGKEPEAQRFRAPDLVWLTGEEQQQAPEDAAFIVLLSSENALTSRTYRHHWLQRFALTGDPVGVPIDLDAVLPEGLRGLNWEGLSWFENGTSLVAVCETSPKGSPVVALVPIPIDWRPGQATGGRG